MDSTTPDEDPAPDPEDDDGPLAPDAEPDAVDEDGDDASPVCLRCFAPLFGSPTRCPNCAAPASLAATLGPSAGGGVDVGGRNVETLDKTYDGRFAPWSIGIVWGLGMLLLPSVLNLVLFADSTARGPGPGAFGGLTRWVPLLVIGGWTVVCAWLFARARARARAACEATKTF